MSKALRLLIAAMAAVVAQTTLVGYIRVAGVAPDLMCALLAAVTSYCGAYGGYCVGAVMALFYDASVGYEMVLKAINMISYALIGIVSPYMRRALGDALRRFKHKSYLEMAVICFVLTAARETVNIGYLFIIGSEQSLTTLIRMLLCSGYSALMVVPVAFLLGKLMAWHPRLGRRREEPEESAPAQRNVVTEPIAQDNRRHKNL